MRFSPTSPDGAAATLLQSNRKTGFDQVKESLRNAVEGNRRRPRVRIGRVPTLQPPRMPKLFVALDTIQSDWKPL
jgi:hypothetical protein